MEALMENFGVEQLQETMARVFQIVNRECEELFRGNDNPPEDEIAIIEDRDLTYAEKIDKLNTLRVNRIELTSQRKVNAEMRAMMRAGRGEQVLDRIAYYKAIASKNPNADAMHSLWALAAVSEVAKVPALPNVG